VAEQQAVPGVAGVAGGYQKIQSLILIIINHLLIGKKRYASSCKIT